MTYLYKCLVHDKFEWEHSIKEKLEFCPKCEEEGLDQQKVDRLINCVTKGVVELYGDELVSKLKNDAKNIQIEASHSDKKYASLLGEERYNQLQTQMDHRGR